MLFAGTNEVHADYNTPTSEHITVQQSYNQTFVNAVRATGGNNASRTLVVQTYNTNIWHGHQLSSRLPTDTIANRLIVEVHHYDPYDYTLNPNGSCLVLGRAVSVAERLHLGAGELSRRPVHPGAREVGRPRASR